MTRCYAFVVLSILAGASAIWLTDASAQVTKASGHSLTVTVTDVMGKQGDLVVSLFTRQDGFPDNVSKATRTAKIPPNKPTHTFANLPEGHYVVVVFHDKNSNGKVDKSLIGIPKEPIGLSNHPSFGPKGGRPDFEKAKVKVSKDTNVSLNLIEIGR